MVETRMSSGHNSAIDDVVTDPAPPAVGVRHKAWCRSPRIASFGSSSVGGALSFCPEHNQATLPVSPDCGWSGPFFEGRAGQMTRHAGALSEACDSMI